MRDFTVRIVMVPMRDGTRLDTVIVVPKGAHDAGIVLDRTPYNANGRIAGAVNDPILKAGYIRLYQDVRASGRAELAGPATLCGRCGVQGAG